MEDLCTLCDPRSERGVAAYPMKAERKKPRVEIDLVNVMEWRSKSDPGNRQFLLVRRPSEGSHCLKRAVVSYLTNHHDRAACRIV